MSIYDKSSLVLIPSGTKTGKIFSQKPVSGDGDFTFTRASAATRVNADGNIEKETGNLTTWSNDLNNWTKVSASVTSGQTGYDGSNDAWRIDSTAGYVRRDVSYSGVNTFSIYAKAGTAVGIRIRLDAASDRNAYYNLSTGAEISHTGISLTATDLGGGWYRIALAANITTGINYRIYATDASGVSTTGNIFVQDAQLEQGLVARDYQETTAVAVYGGITDNTPRLDYTDSSCPALLLEPLRTNIIESSEYLNHSTWINTSLTITDNVVTSPEGVVNAAKIVALSSGSRLENNMSITGGTNFTISCFVKKTGSGTSFDYIRFQSYKANDGFRCWFNITNGTKGTEATFGSGVIVDSNIQDYGDGWYKISVTGNIPSSFPIFWIVPSTADNVNNVPVNSEYYMWGAQAEAGSYATSYIPTYGSSVSRVQDNTLNSSAASVIGQTEGSIYAEVDFKAISEESRFVQLSDGTNSNRFLVGSTSTNGVQVYVVSGGAVQWTPATTPYTDGLIKVAVAYKNNDYAMYVNGTQINTSSSASVPAMDEISVGYNSIVGNRPSAYGHRKVMLFKTRLSNEELADLTTL
jgi:hypothetical protein